MAHQKAGPGSVHASLRHGMQVPAHTSIAQLIQGRANAAYTSIMVDRGMRVVDWPLHLERLARSIDLLHHDNPALFAALFAWGGMEQGGMVSLQASLAPHLERLVSQALTKFSHQQSSIEAVQLAASATLHDVALPQQGPHACAGMLFVLVGERLQGNTQQGPTAAATATAHANDQPYKEFSSEVSSNSQEHGSMLETPPVDIEVLVMPFTAPSPDAGVDVVVLGPPRDIVHAKHADWMRVRKPLEDAKPPRMAEVLLCDERGGLLEGLVTNVAVVTMRAADGQPVLHTTGPNGLALPGIMLRRVLDACHVVGVDVILEPPQALHRDTWHEAFLTNCLRGIQPIQKIVCPPGNHWGHEPWEVDLTVSAPGPVTRQLQAAVTALQLRSSASDLSAGRFT